MTQNRSEMVVKVLATATAVLIFGLAAFGVGVKVGAAGTPSTSLYAPEEMDSSARPTLPAPGATGQAPAPAGALADPASSAGAGSMSSPLDSRLFAEAWKLLEQQFYGDLPQDSEVTYAAIRGVVRDLDDPHTAFLNPKQAEAFNSDIQGHFEGIGARVDTAEGGGVEVKYLFADQPAQKAGLQVGDIIIAVDGEDVTGMDLNDAISLIRGPEGTEVTLMIERKGSAPFDIKVRRARIEIPVVETKSLADGEVAYVSLGEFSTVAPRRLSEAVADALRDKPAGLILDLRGNPGGLLDAAVEIGSYFVPEGNILIERFRDGREQVYRRQGRYLLGDTPLAVLVDAGSASASEIVAGAIQDAGTGVLIGETTYGKGSVQQPNALSDGSQLRITIARWFTPEDREIHGAGLQPDIAVPITEDDVQAGRDPQLDRALEYLLTGK